MKNYKTISKGVEDFLRESEGEFCLNCIDKNGDTITSDYIINEQAALNSMQSLCDTYKEYGTENAYGLELYDNNNNLIASAKHPVWRLNRAKINESENESENLDEGGIESVDAAKRDLGIESGSDEEDTLNSLFDRKIKSYTCPECGGQIESINDFGRTKYDGVVRCPKCRATIMRDDLKVNYLDESKAAYRGRKLKEDEAAVNDAEEYIFDDYKEYGEFPEYDSFTYSVMDISKPDFNKAVKNVSKVVDTIKNHIYNVDGTEMLELHAHYTAYRLGDNGKDDQDWYNIVKTAMDSFEENTGVTLYAEGRMGRHMCVDYTYENAKRYDELVQVCEDLENQAVERFNAVDDEDVNESEDTDLASDVVRYMYNKYPEIPFIGEETSQGYNKTYTVLKFDLSNKDRDAEKRNEVEKELKAKFPQVEFGSSQNTNAPEIVKFAVLVPQDDINESSLKEQVLSDDIEQEITDILGDLEKLAKEIDGIADDVIYLDNRIADLNKRTSLSISSLDFTRLTKITKDAREDLEYALKNSEWSKEDTIDIEEKQSEKMNESERTIHLEDGDKTVNKDFYVILSNSDQEDFMVEEFDSESDARDWAMRQYRYNGFGASVYNNKSGEEVYHIDPDSANSDSDDYDQNQFTMYNQDHDKKVKVWKSEIDNRWHDSEGNRYMGYLSKADVKRYFKGNWRELDESQDIQDMSDEQLKKLAKEQIKTGKLTMRKLYRVIDPDEVSKIVSQDDLNRKGKYTTVRGSGIAKVIDSLDSEQIRDLCFDLGIKPKLKEGMLWGDDRDYDSKMMEEMNKYLEELITEFKNSGWAYDEKSSRFGHHHFIKNGVDVDYCDNVDKVGLADVSSEAFVGLSKRSIDEYRSSDDSYFGIDFRWSHPSASRVVGFCNNAADSSTKN